MIKIRNRFDIWRSVFPIVLSILAVVATTAPVWANSDASNTITATIKLTTATKIGGTQLAAGEYKVIVDGSQAKFQRGSKVVAQIPCTLKDLDFMPQTTIFVLDQGSISEIQVAGNIKGIEFSSGL